MIFRPNSYNNTSDINAQVAFDQGLRSYMLRVYNWMASGLLLTALVSYVVVQYDKTVGYLFYKTVYTVGYATSLQPTALGWLAIFSPFAFILVMQLGINRISVKTSQLLFWALCAAMGVSMANLFYVYTEESIVRTFLICSCMFAFMSLWGYTTQRNLTGLGNFLIMGLFGLVLTMVLNIFIKSSGLSLLLNIAGVGIFTFFAATDTQRMKLSYQAFYQYEGPEMAAKRSVMDALNLYLNFINLFQFLLQLIGDRQR